MSHRYVASVSVLAAAIAVVLLAPVLAQAPSPAARAGAPARTWKVPRTPDGQPDLQGFWTNTTYTPLERPKNITKEFYTKEEALEHREEGGSRRGRGDGTRNHRRRALRLHAVWPGPQPGRVRVEPAYVADRGSAGRETSAAVGGGTEASRRAGTGEKANGRRHRRRPEPAVERALHHHGPRRTADASRGLQQQLSNRADAGKRDDSRRDDPSRPHHPDRRASPSAAKRPPVDGKLYRPLGGRHPGRGDDEFHRQEPPSRAPARTCV